MTTTTGSRIGPRQIGIIVPAIATAAIQFSRAAADPEIRTLFILNGVGYLALTAMYFASMPPLARYRGIIGWIFIVYTAITIIFYVIWGGMSGDWVMPLGPLDKVIELVLIALLLMDRSA
jgi:hypothetical protein